MFELGEKITTKKNHPCGGNTWEIVRNGADYKIKCLTCGRVVMLTPDELKKRTKSSVSAKKTTEGKKE